MKRGGSSSTLTASRCASAPRCATRRWPMLRRIAQGRPDVFYRGEVARDRRQIARPPGQPRPVVEGPDGYRARSVRRCASSTARRHAAAAFLGHAGLAQVMGLLADHATWPPRRPRGCALGLEPAPEAVHLIPARPSVSPSPTANPTIGPIPDFVTVDSTAMLDDDYLRRRAADRREEHGPRRTGPRGAVMALADDRSPSCPRPRSSRWSTVSAMRSP